MKKTVTVSSLIAVLIIAAAAIFWSAASKDVPSVELVEAKLAVLQGSINTNGKVEAEKTFEIRAPFSGFVRQVLAREGDRLTKGQPILTLDDASMQSELAAARAELRSAEVDARDIQRGPPLEELNQAEAEVTRYRLELEAARKTHETNQWLLERNAISRSEVEQSRQTVARLQQALDAATTRRNDLRKRYDEVDRTRAAARVEAAKARIEYLENSISRSVVRAPANGALYQFELRTGAYLNAGDLIGLLADLGNLRVRAFVDEPELSRVSYGAQVVVRWDARPQETWKAIVVHVPSQVVARGSRSVAEVLCTIQGPKQTLIPNVNVDVEIMAAGQPQVLSLPRNAVFYADNKHFVWIPQNGKAVKQTIETGRSTSSLIEVTGGLSAGERVIVPGDVTLREGMNVRVAGQ